MNANIKSTAKVIVERNKSSNRNRKFMLRVQKHMTAEDWLQLKLNEPKGQILQRPIIIVSSSRRTVRNFIVVCCPCSCLLRLPPGFVWREPFRVLGSLQGGSTLMFEHSVNDQP